MCLTEEEPVKCLHVFFSTMTVDDITHKVGRSAFGILGFVFFPGVALLT